MQLSTFDILVNLADALFQRDLQDKLELSALLKGFALNDWPIMLNL